MSALPCAVSADLAQLAREEAAADALERAYQSFCHERSDGDQLTAMLRWMDETKSIEGRLASPAGVYTTIAVDLHDAFGRWDFVQWQKGRGGVLS